MPNKMYQTRIDGLCVEYTSLLEALRTRNEKVSFTEDGARVILRSDGTWEVWTTNGIYKASGFTKWVDEIDKELSGGDK